MSIFETKDYRKIIRERLEGPAKRGQQSQLAKALGVHTTTLSQIMSGAKPLSLEVAALICDHFSFTEPESEFFLLLVQLSRAGNPSLKTKLEKRITLLKERSSQLSKLLPNDKTLDLKNQLIFYSDWKYSAVRVLSSIPGYQDVNGIAEKLQAPRKAIAEIAKFLVEQGLCVEKKGKLAPGPRYTHLPASSPLSSKHHGNLRLKAMAHHASLSPDDLAYGSLMSFSREDAKKIRASLVKFISQLNQIRNDTNPETAQLLTIDWIEL